ncbi:membrane-spanning 4-domains subfamily A member 4A [Nannospalax galili]|uniref:Membrane-spanning 4-domains, subfamily A, member 4A n=1 Tax=Nannospalax galili TaxID=1026970 RepID=A0A8C6RNZ4_NANGA|nr:membrane-spanning 4-domains subfamily A member 4A [Nannospalax galili]
MTTMWGTEQTTLEAGLGAQQQGLPFRLHSKLWKRMAEKFLRGEPKILGVVQIMIALLNFSIGILMMSVTLPFRSFHPVSVYISYPIWGSVMFIISGSFSIAAARRTTKGLVASSLGLNVTSSVFAFSGIIISALSPGIYSFQLYYCNHNDTEGNFCMTTSILMGLDIMVAVLSVLEFCIAVALSAFGCKVTCCYTGEVVILMPPSLPMAETASPASFQEGLMSPAPQEKSVPENQH